MCCMILKLSFNSKWEYWKHLCDVWKLRMVSDKICIYYNNMQYTTVTTFNDKNILIELIAIGLPNHVRDKIVREINIGRNA